MRQVSVMDEDGDMYYTTIGWSLKDKWGFPVHQREIVGVSIEGIYWQPQARRLIVETYSIWKDKSNPNGVIGEGYHVASPEEVDYLIRQSILPAEWIRLLPASYQESLYRTY